MGIKRNKNDMIDLLICYGPNEDRRVGKRNSFWKELLETWATSKERIIFIGDINSRIGNYAKTG